VSDERTNASVKPGDRVGDPYIGYAEVVSSHQPSEIVGFHADGRYFYGSNAGRCALFGVASSRELASQVAGKLRLEKLAKRGANSPTKEEQ
jgi:hypothetical protein